MLSNQLTNIIWFNYKKFDHPLLNDFKSRFEEGKDISYKDYYNFCMEYIDDMSEVYYIKKNWREEY